MSGRYNLNNTQRNSLDSVARYILSLFPRLHTPFPTFSPSLISLIVSVDVKHHVYLLTYFQFRQGVTYCRLLFTSKMIHAQCLIVAMAKNVNRTIIQNTECRIFIVYELHRNVPYDCTDKRYK